MKKSEKIKNLSSAINALEKRVETVLKQNAAFSRQLKKFETHEKRIRLKKSKKPSHWQAVCPNGHIGVFENMTKSKLSKIGDDLYLLERWVECPQCHTKTSMVKDSVARLSLPLEAQSAFEKLDNPAA